MARLPIPVTAVAASGASNLPRASASSFGGGAGLAAIGAGLGQIGDALAAREKENNTFEASKFISNERVTNAVDLNTQIQDAEDGGANLTKDVLTFGREREQTVADAAREAGLDEDGVKRAVLAAKANTLSNVKKALPLEAKLSGAKIARDVDAFTTAATQNALNGFDKIEDIVVNNNKLIDDIPNHKANATQREALKVDAAKKIVTAGLQRMVNRRSDFIVSKLSPTGGGKGGRQGLKNRIRGSESGGTKNPAQVKNKNTSAFGFFQIVEQTWNNIAASPAGRAAGIPSFEKGKRSEKFQNKVMDLLLDDSTRVLNNQGIPPTGANLFIAHRLGSGRVAQILALPDNTPANRAFTARERKFNSDLRRMTVGQFKRFAARVGGGAITAKTGKTGNFVLDNADAGQRQRALNAAFARQGRVASEIKTDIIQQAKDDEARMRTTGVEPTTPLTIDQFNAAFPDDPEQAQKLFDRITSQLATAKIENGFSTQSPTVIAEAVESVRPDPKSEDFAFQQANFNRTQAAAARVAKSRAADPTADIIRTAEDAREQAKIVSDNPGDPKERENLMRMIAAEHDFRSTPEDKRTLLPKSTVTDTIEAFKKTNDGVDARVAALVGLVFTTNDAEQQTKIFDQLVEQDSSLAVFRPAVEALARGDKPASDRLFASSMETVDLKASGSSIKLSDINLALGASVFKDGEIGFVANKMAAGSLDTLARTKIDMQAARNLVSALVVAGKHTTETAVEQAKADLYGNVKVVDNGETVSVTVPNSSDVRVVEAGLKDAADTIMRDALEQMVPTNQIGDETVGQSARRIRFAEDNVEWMITHGQWVNGPGGDTFQFVDGSNGKAVTGADGEVISVSLEEIERLGTVVRERQTFVGSEARIVAEKAGVLSDLELSREDLIRGGSGVVKDENSTVRFLTPEENAAAALAEKRGKP